MTLISIVTLFYSIYTESSLIHPKQSIKHHHDRPIPSPDQSPIFFPPPNPCASNHFSSCSSTKHSSTILSASIHLGSGLRKLLIESGDRGTFNEPRLFSKPVIVRRSFDPASSFRTAIVFPHLSSRHLPDLPSFPSLLLCTNFSPGSRGACSCFVGVSNGVWTVSSFKIGYSAVESAIIARLVAASSACPFSNIGCRFKSAGRSCFR